MIDPEFWSDEEIGQWSFQARLFYIALWNFSDDEGRFKAHSVLLKAQIFPYDRKIDIKRLQKEIQKKVLWYEVEGLQYGWIRNFLRYQKIDHPSESKLPKPHRSLTEASPNSQERVPPNIKEVNIREENIRAARSFEKFWNDYPNKVGKKEAERHFKATVKTEEDLKNIRQALVNYKKSDRVRKGYIQNGSTWFNNWQDWITPPEPKKDDFDEKWEKKK